MADGGLSYETIFQFKLRMRRSNAKVYKHSLEIDEFSVPPK